MSVEIFQPKGKAHIKYIHEKAKEIYQTLYQCNEAHWIDALQLAMKEHRSYLIVNLPIPKPIKGTYWRENGIWKPL